MDLSPLSFAMCRKWNLVTDRSTRNLEMRIPSHWYSGKLDSTLSSKAKIDVPLVLAREVIQCRVYGR